MKMIVGLGNPDKKYQKTRHNFGFRVLDWLAETKEVSFKYELKFDAETCETMVGSEKVLLVKPQTYMNNSGRAVQRIKQYFKISDYEIIVLYDDNDLEFGDIRTTGTSAGGHKGMDSIISELGTKEIARVRLGIHNESEIPTENFVLQEFNPREESEISEPIEKAAKEVTNWLKS